MDWTASTAWWLAAGALVAAELATGTFYLLMLALGAAAGAVAAHLGLSGNLQIATAAVLGGGAVGAWHLGRPSAAAALPAAANPDVFLDIGSTVQVVRWQADGSARVHYRGSEWNARHVGAGPATAGEHTIRAVEGSRLLLDPTPR
jgi:membrane protein implicated in regulation of membrane protease activity